MTSPALTTRTSRTRTARLDHDALGPPRWRGQAGRLEVWYLTATDPRTGTGLWLHHEVVAPTEWRRLGPEAAGRVLALYAR